jgi:branched-chain amino acid transport system permease protein
MPLFVVIGAALLALGATFGFSSYYTFLATSVLVTAIALMGLGVVTGTAGMIALCQLAFAGIAGWVVAWLGEIGFPGGFTTYMIIGAIASTVAGILVGLPALRLRGVNLAVLTLGIAAAADVTLQKIQFPGNAEGKTIPRPDMFTTDRWFFFYVALVAIILGLAVFYLQRSRWGSSWKSVAFSERGTASAGTSVSMAKLTAFAVSAFIGGISGALLVAQVQTPYSSSFNTISSLSLYVLSIVAGSYLVDMALFGGILFVAVPEILKKAGVALDWGTVLFGVLGIQALTTNSNLGQDIRNALGRRKRKRLAMAVADLTIPAVKTETPIPSGDGRPLLTVTDLSVTFGQVKALQHVNLEVTEGSILGLIGPNGAGKSTFVDAITGFLPQHEGSAVLDGIDLKKLVPHRRARIGLRRTFQQDRVPTTLTVGAYVRFIARGKVSQSEIAEILEFFGCPGADTPLAVVDVGTRRLIEVAANVAARPKLLLLDEPAAGLSHDEHLAFGEKLRAIPGRYGVTLLIIEHDLDLVRSVCTKLVVLNFGEVLADGPQNEVLANPEVLKAYMGETEML